MLHRHPHHRAPDGGTSGTRYRGGTGIVSKFKKRKADSEE